jgi:hypothetical protein
MLYYYAHTGHKVGLERAKRGSAFIRALAKAGVEAQLLVNDFRAGIAMETYGINSYVTIETVRDIDAIASMGDAVVIDSPEDHNGRLEKYCSEYKVVFRFAENEHDRVCYEEIVIQPFCKEEACIKSVAIDDVYFEKRAKEERLLFFIGDEDHNKMILQYPHFFQAFNMELLLGHYFYVSYERALAPLFQTMHESEAYVDLIQSSSCVVTASGQMALEAKAAGATVVYLDLERPSLYPVTLLSLYGIHVVKGFDVEAVKIALEEKNRLLIPDIPKININKIKSLYQKN